MQAAAITSRLLTGYSSKAGFADAEAVVSTDGSLHHIVASHLIRTVGSQELFLRVANGGPFEQSLGFVFLAPSVDSESVIVQTDLPRRIYRQVSQYPTHLFKPVPDHA